MSDRLPLPPPIDHGEGRFKRHFLLCRRAERLGTDLPLEGRLVFATRSNARLSTLVDEVSKRVRMVPHGPSILGRCPQTLCKYILTHPRLHSRRCVRALLPLLLAAYLQSSFRNIRTDSSAETNRSNKEKRNRVDVDALRLFASVPPYLLPPLSVTKRRMPPSSNRPGIVVLKTT